MTNETTRTHVPMDVQPETHINAPVNVHGWCFGLIPANGNWLDDIIDWHKRQFRQAAVARRLAACWNACRSISTEDLERYFGTGVGIDEAKAMTRSRHVADVRDGIRAALGVARAAAGVAAGPTAPVEPVGYLNVVYGTFFRPAELAATDRTRELMESGEIIAVYRAATPAQSNSAEDRVRSPYVLGVKPGNYAVQIAAGAPDMTTQADRDIYGSLRKDTGTRLRRVAKLAGLSDAMLAGDDEQLFDCAFSTLGKIAYALEYLAVPQIGATNGLDVANVTAAEVTNG